MKSVGAMDKAVFGPMRVVFANTAVERKDLVMIIDAPPR